MLPFISIGEELGKNIYTHVIGGTNLHRKVLVLKAFGKPRKTYPMSSPNVTHCGVLTCAHYLGTRLIVLEELA